VKKSCDYCGRKRVGDPSDYYHEKSCEAKHLSRMISENKYADESELRKLQSRLKMALYVGD
jgi:hypothetical protein